MERMRKDKINEFISQHKTNCFSLEHLSDFKDFLKQSFLKQNKKFLIRAKKIIKLKHSPYFHYTHSNRLVCY